MNENGNYKSKESNVMPEYMVILSIDDKKGYEKLRKQISSSHYRFNRNKRISTLIDILKQIREYCEYKETDKSKRYLVCGICWFGEFLAVNIKQLRFLISKSKSTLNDGLLKIGYSRVQAKGEHSSLLIQNIPFLLGNNYELKKWSIRRKKIDIKSVDEDDMYKEDILFLDEIFKNFNFDKNKDDSTNLIDDKSKNENINFSFHQNKNDCLMKNDDEGFEIFNNFDFEFIEFN